MTKKAYSNLLLGKQTLRDKLAIERTALANERTLLSYVRTTIALTAVGGTLIKVFTEWYMMLAGWFFISLAATLLIIGFMRYIRMYLLVNAIEKADMEKELREDRLQHLLWLALEKLHLTS